MILSGQAIAIAALCRVGELVFQEDGIGLRPPGSEPVVGLPSYGEQLVRMLTTLGVILLVLLVVAKLLPRWVRSTQAEDRGDALDVVAVRRVDAKTRVILVRAGAEHVLFAVTPTGAVRLASGPSLDPEFRGEAHGAFEAARSSSAAGSREGATKGAADGAIGGGRR